MSDRFPLIVNSVTNKIEELSPGDNLNLQNSGIVGATTVTASNFVGNLQGTATNSYNLISAENISSGTISSSRLSGNYNINVTSSNILNSAENISSGTISSSRLSGQYPISITGTASTSYYLTSAENILSGIIPAERLSGTYQINVSSASTAFDLSPGIYSIDILGNAQTAITATNLSGGNVSGTTLDISGVSTISTLGVSGIITTKDFMSVGVSTISTLGVSGIITTKDFMSVGVSTFQSILFGDQAVFAGIITCASVSTPSDYNLKVNIKKIEDALDKVLQLDGVTFDWMGTNNSSVGVIAQEVEKVLPELILGENPKSVNYSGFVGVFIECIKELKREINYVEEKIDKLLRDD